MIVSVATLWFFKHYVQAPATTTGCTQPQEETPPEAAGDVSAAQQSASRNNAVEGVPEWQRIGALLIVFLIVIVFWMVFHQNGSTLTYWAKDNSDWNVTRVISNENRVVLGIISNLFNPFWVVTMTFPVVWFWRWLDRKGREPATPTKMACGMS